MTHTTKFRPTALAVAAVSLLAATSAQAQFGGLSIGSLGKKSTTEQTTATGCPEGKKKSVGASILGSVAGSVASRAAGRFASFVPIPALADTLTSAIACKLDEKEQKQAADATVAITSGDATTGEVKVGDTAEWTSGTRKNVRGTSTIVAIEAPPPEPAAPASSGKGKGKGQGEGKGKQLAAGGPQCITVSDVVIVNGEETTANKRMCKAPGKARYTLMA